MIDLRAIANAASHYKNDPAKTHADYLKDLSDLAHQLNKIAEIASNPTIKKTFAHRADQALSTCHTIAANKRIAPLAYSLQMIEIENLAKSFLGRFQQIEERNLQSQANAVKKNEDDLKKKAALAESVKNLREALFLALQDEEFVDATASLNEIEGDSIDAVMRCIKECQWFAQNLPREFYEDFFQKWDLFDISILRKTHTAIQFFDAATEALLPVSELNIEQSQHLTKAIEANDESELKNLMAKLPMNQLSNDEKIKIAKLAIQSTSLTPLLVFSECEWLIDLIDEEGVKLMNYAKNQKRRDHQQILEELYKNAKIIDSKATKHK